MVEQAVEHRADGGCISQKFSPVFDRAIRSQHRAGPRGGPLKPGFGLSGDVHTSQTWSGERN